MKSMNQLFSDFKAMILEKMSNHETVEAVPKTKMDKVLHFLEHIPWSATVLGLGVCGLLVFRPEISSMLQMFIH